MRDLGLAVRRVPTVFDRLTERTLCGRRGAVCRSERGSERNLVAILIGTVTRDKAGVINRRRLRKSAKTGNLP